MKLRYTAITAVLLIALTGCAGTPEEAPSEAVASGKSAAPLVAETAKAHEGNESEFLTEVRELLPALTQIPDATDDQLIASGREACERMAEGETSDDIVLIDGEKANPDSGLYLDTIAILTAAVRDLCP